MKVVYVYADAPEEWNCSEWRCAAPARAVNRTSRHTAELLDINEFAFNTPKARKICGVADIIVVERKLFGPVLSAIQHWKARDKVVIADFDDAYNLMPASNPNYSFWIEGLIKRAGSPPEKVDPPPMTQFKWGLKMVDGVTVPSRRLVDDWGPYGNVYYAPNYIDLEKYQNTTSQSHDEIIIGWGGSVSHFQSFMNSGIMTALKRVCQTRPQVRVMICGNDRRIFEQLPLPPEQKIHQPWVSYSNWPQVLSRFDIGLAPLVGAYDERRSWIKVLEYMVMKIPWVASEGPPYYDLRQYGWIVKNNANAWERILMDMVDHIDDYRTEAACEAYLFGISQSIDENIDKIITTYAAISAKVASNANG